MEVGQLLPAMKGPNNTYRDRNLLVDTVAELTRTCMGSKHGTDTGSCLNGIPPQSKAPQV